MPRLPAFCRSCSAVYASPLRAEGPGEENAFEVPLACPRCGESGRVPPGMLRSTALAVAGLRDAEDEPGTEGATDERPESRRGPEAADALRGLRKAAEGSLSRIELTRRLSSARPPALAALAGALPEAIGPDDDVEPYLRLWAEAAALLRGGEQPEEGTAGPPAGGDEAPAAERVAVRAVARLLAREGVEAATRGPSDEVRRARGRLRSTNRNDPCPCGSGEKYKSCHWRADLEITRR